MFDNEKTESEAEKKIRLEKEAADKKIADEKAAAEQKIADEKAAEKKSATKSPKKSMSTVRKING